VEIARYGLGRNVVLCKSLGNHESILKLYFCFLLCFLLIVSFYILSAGMVVMNSFMYWTNSQLFKPFYSNCMMETKLPMCVTKCQKDVPPATKTKPRGSKIYNCNHCDMVFTARKFVTAHTKRVSCISKHTWLFQWWKSYLMYMYTYHVELNIRWEVFGPLIISNIGGSWPFHRT
jgi:uncharacterized C2H2 Zn-finger protein